MPRPIKYPLPWKPGDVFYKDDQLGYIYKMELYKTVAYAWGKTLLSTNSAEQLFSWLKNERGGAQVFLDYVKDLKIRPARVCNCSNLLDVHPIDPDHLRDLVPESLIIHNGSIEVVKHIVHLIYIKNPFGVLDLKTSAHLIGKGDCSIEGCIPCSGEGQWLEE